MDTNNQPWWRDSVITFTRLSAWIVGPVIAALIIGRWLDQKFDSGPWIFLGLTAMAFVVSMIILVRETRKSIDTITRNDNDNNDSTNN